MDPRWAAGYFGQVWAVPHQWPASNVLIPPTLQFNQGVLQQPFILVAPHSHTVHQQGSSGVSLYPGVVSIPVYHGSYCDHNLRNHPTIRPLSTQCHPPKQVSRESLFHSHLVRASNFNAQVSSIPSDMKGSNQMTVLTTPSSIQRIQRPPELKIEATFSISQINFGPGEQTSAKTPLSVTEGREDAIYIENFGYLEEKNERHSNLYVGWNGTANQLRDKLESKSLEVNSILITTVKNLWNVVFDSHSSARKAFNTQRQIEIRMVPPRGSKKHWFRNPGPDFLVQYETKCRLAVREGKSVCGDLVGKLLMSGSDSKERRGCTIWADQLKGHRIRIVGFVGKFMFPSKRVINIEEIPAKLNANDPIG